MLRRQLRERGGHALALVAGDDEPAASGASPAGQWSGSGSARRRACLRSASTALFRAIANSHVLTLARRGSNWPAFRHAVTNTSWMQSSASWRSPSVRTERPKRTGA